MERAGLAFEAGQEHEVLRGVDLSARPHVYWLHEAQPRPGSTVALNAGSRPLLVLGSHGEGRVASFLGTPMGIPGEGQVPFWEWDGWPGLLRNVLRWLGGDR